MIPRSSGSAAAPRWARLALCALLAVVLAWQLAQVVGAATSRNLMFDGAMNLALAKSIAAGHGPRAIYDAAVLYPVGVQSKEPLYLLGAVVFKLLGVGPFQAQLANLVYFMLFVGVMLLLARRAGGVAMALVAGVLALSTPALQQYALNGYGEVPTAFFGLCALLVLVWPTRLPRGLGWWAFIAGMLAGLAFATKVVGIAQIAMAGMVLCLRVWSDGEHRSLRVLMLPAFAFAAGTLLPTILVETWRLHWLGTGGYTDWWRFQVESIVAQSGAKPRLAQAPVSHKIGEHLGILARELGLSRTGTCALLATPFVALALAFARKRPALPARYRWLALGLSFVVVPYLVWWLAFVPTDKAWLRYLYIPLLYLAILASLAIGSNAWLAKRTDDRRLAALHVLCAVATCMVYAHFISASISTRPEFGPSEEVQAVRYAAHVIDKLPPDRLAFGYGWYAAPTVQLYAARPFYDLTDWPLGRMTNKPAYLVADRASLMTGILDRVLARYPHRRLMRKNPFAQVYELDFSRPSDPFASMATGNASAFADFARGYSLVSGMEPYDPMGGRFAESDSEVLLRYEGQSTLRIAAYMALPKYYLLPHPLRGRAMVGDCQPLEIAFSQSGWSTFALPLACHPEPGSDVRVRLLWDNVFDLPYVYDHQRAVLIQGIGFSD